MAPSISHASSPEAARFGLGELRRFYRWNAPIYDWTRPFILWGREALLEGLDLRANDHVLDVGCGTGWSFGRLAPAGLWVTGVEPSREMRRRAAHRARALGVEWRVTLDAHAFGTDDRYRSAADRVLLSYSLSMIPPFPEVIAAAREALTAGGRIGVVDFLDAAPGVRQWLEGSHVHLGPDRLDALRAAFKRHRYEVRAGLGWRYFLFWGY